MATPASDPAAASVTLSISCSANSRPRVAPRAARTASWWRAETACAVASPARLVATIKSSSAAAAAVATSAGCDEPTSSSRSRAGDPRLAGVHLRKALLLLA